MIISNGQIHNLIAQYSKNNSKVTNKGKEDFKGTLQKSVDQISVSNDAQAYLVAKQAIKNLPDVREEKLAEIEQRVKAGTYEVADDEIAEKMIGRSLVDKLV